MKAGLETFRRRYLAALRRYLRDGTVEHGQAGAELVREALVRGLGERVLIGLHRAAVRDSVPNRAAPSADEAAAERFLAASLLPLEEARVASLADNRKQVVLVGVLSRRVGRLEEANRVLAVELEESRAAEKVLRVREATTVVELETARRTRDELRVLTRGLLTVQEEERKRISRELHDVVSQALTAINLRLATLDIQTTGDAEEMHRKIALTQVLVEKSVATVHRFARDLRPSALNDLGLIPALAAFIKGYEAESGVVVEFRAAAGVEEQRDVIRDALFRVIQEALTNVTRHAKASLVRLLIRQTAKETVVTIADNGCGFAVQEVAVVAGACRLGLLGMKERVEMVGGEFSVKSEPGKGTVVRVTVPLSNSQKGGA
jgi:signal transduction histidine kinase